MRRYKRYLEDELVDVPRSTRHRMQIDAADDLPENVVNRQEIDETEADYININQDGEDPKEPEPVLPNIIDDDAYYDAEGEANFVNNEQLEEEEEEYADYLFGNANGAQNEGDEYLYPGAQITRSQSEAVILSYVTRYHISEIGLRDLLEVINLHSPSVLHQSKYYFLKDLNMTKSVERHYYCESCMSGLDFTEKSNIAKCSQETCELFKHDQNRSVLKRKGSFFLHMPLGPQLAALLNEDELRRKLRADNVTKSDVPSGNMYKSLASEIGPHDITLQWNTDGASASKSSKCSIWPIQVAINELPLRERKEHILLTSLWQGPKPNMDLFLKPFVEELKDLHSNGIILANGTLVKVHCLVASVDSVARPLLQNIKQFNGMHGCSYCLKPGERVERGNGFSRVYCGEVDQERTEENHFSDAVEATDTGTSINGVKGPSQLMLVPVFNIISSFVPDYLHNLLLGIVRWHMFEWFDPKNSNQVWYLGSKNKTRIFEDRLCSIVPPSEVTRAPRSFSLNKKLWKASEYRSFLLYYSLPCLTGLLPNQYLRHWMLLVYSVTIYLHEKILQPDLQQAKIAITKFVLDTETLYGREWMTYNMHTCLHIPQAVENWGALWGSSTFMFEHFNGVLLNLFSGTQHISDQIFKNYDRIKKMKRAINSRPNENWSPMARKLLKNLAGKYFSYSAKCSNSVVSFGAPKNVTLSIFHQIAIEAYLQEHLGVDEVNLQTQLSCYKRFLVHGMILNSSDYDRLQRRRNDLVRLDDGHLFQILYLMDLGINIQNIFHRYIIVGHHLDLLDGNICTNGQFKSSAFIHPMRMPREDSATVVIHPNSIVRKCMTITVNETCRLAENTGRSSG